MSLVPKASLVRLAAIFLAAGTVWAQQFSDVLISSSGYPGLTDQCAEALNSTVQSCPGFLAEASVDMPRLDSTSLEALCTSACRSSLESVRNTIASGCGASQDVIMVDAVVYPATFVIDRYLYTYDVSCMKDSTTGRFCDEIYLESLGSRTAVDSCSDCSLSVVRAQLNSPFGFDEDFAAGFANITASCGATGYGFTTPGSYAITTQPPTATGTPTCGSPYVVQAGDTCDSIAVSRRVSTYSVIKAAGTDPDCSSGLQAGTSLCLPEACEQHRVEVDETCEEIVASVPGLRATDLLSWNPDLNPLCTNVDIFFGKLMCISPPGRTLADVTKITTAPVTTQPPATAVPRPPNAKAESHEACAGWYEVQDGDFCQTISIRQAISLRDFFFLNPSVDDPDCSNLWLDTSYCVRAVGDINTYSGYPYSTSPVYTLTSSDYVTTTQGMISTVRPSATPVVELPLAPDSHSEAQGCLGYSDHRVVTPQMDQSVQTDMPYFTESINSCDFVVAAAGAVLEEFLTWNPSLQGMDPCQLQPGFKYCSSHSDAEGPVEGWRNCLNVTEPYPGTVSDCSCFTKIAAYDAGLYSCEDMALDFNVTLSDFVRWNSWVGSGSGCSAALYAGLEGSEERPVCVGAGGGGGSDPITTGAPTTTTAAPVPSPTAPTQPGIVAGCQKYYTAVIGDGCWAIANDNGISLDDFYAWNPAVGTDCGGLWPDYAYCIQGPASATTTAASTTTGGGVSPPGPTQPGIIGSCTQWHTVVSGEGCWGIQQIYGIPDFATLLGWNPSLGSNCENLWPDYSICVGV